MKKLFTRLLAFVIMLTYIGTNILIPNLQVYADDLDSFDLTNLIAHEQSLVEATMECMAEAAFDQAVANATASVQSDNFYVLHNIDHLPYNTIHILVQNHIRYSNPQLKNNELGFTYTTDKDELNNKNDDWKEVLNEYKNQCSEDSNLNSILIKLKDFIKYRGKRGSIDLWANEGNYVYVWEVKPPSYENFPKRILGLEQLYRYITLSKDKVGGNLQYAPEQLVFLSGGSGNDFMPNPEGTFAFKWDNGVEDVLYKVRYSAQSDGLVIYHFDRYAAKKEEQEQEQPDRVEEWETELELTYVPVYETQLDPLYVPEPGFANEKTQAQNEAWKETLGNAVEIGANAAAGTGLIYVSVKVIKYIQAVAVGSGIKDAIKNYVLSKYTSLKEKYGITMSLSALCTAILTRPLPVSATELEDDPTEGGKKVGLTPEEYDIISDLIMLLTDGEYDISDYEDDYEAESLADDIQNNYDNYIKAEEQAPPRNPLIIHFANTNEIEFTTLDDGVNFDLDKNGFAEKTAWTKNNDGFLAIDLNGNGFIDDGGELFGDNFIMPDGKISSTGFEALKSLDEDDNNRIDENDSVFKELFVWFDTENKGFTDGGELKKLTEIGILYIDLNYVSDTYEQEESGTRREETSYVYFNDGSTKRISEFWFPVNSTDTTHRGEETVGNVPSIEQAIENDESGELYALCHAFNRTNDINQKHYYLKKILYNITGSDNIDASSRGGNIDARDLHVIEQFMGHDFEGVSGSNPNAPAAEILKGIYHNIENSYYNMLNLKLSFGGILTLKYIGIDEYGNEILDISLIEEFIDLKIENEGEDAYILVYDLGVYLKSYDKLNETDMFSSFSEYYSSKSQNLAEIVNLIGTTYTYVGTDMNDTYVGTNTTNFIFGDDGDDVLNGSKNADHIYGGFGDDTLKGNIGNDVYYIDLFHGNDVIYDTDGDNKIVFSDYYRIGDYNISISVNGGFVLTNKYTDETISLPDFLTNPINYDFIFNGETQTLGGGEPREVIEGTAEDNYLEAGDGFNVFYGGDGNDTLAGGANMDFMYGENGDDLDHSQ